MLKHPPDFLITTPESLFLLLTSQARETLRNVETVIIDEVHASLYENKDPRQAVRDLMLRDAKPELYPQ